MIGRAVDANGQLEDPGVAGALRGASRNFEFGLQNESIADSNVELASDLRRQVREMLVAGKERRGEIFDFMTERYGEFVRFIRTVRSQDCVDLGRNV